ncbi:MAG: hypothetical protein N2235_18350 [Fischerella sp.]|nr:hypothetical protein [Fischerella sp.]
MSVVTQSPRRLAMDAILITILLAAYIIVMKKQIKQVEPSSDENYSGLVAEK